MAMNKSEQQLRDAAVSRLSKTLPSVAAEIKSSKFTTVDNEINQLGNELEDLDDDEVREASMDNMQCLSPPPVTSRKILQ